MRRTNLRSKSILLPAILAVLNQMVMRSNFWRVAAIQVMQAEDRALQIEMDSDFELIEFV